MLMMPNFHTIKELLRHTTQKHMLRLLNEILELIGNYNYEHFTIRLFKGSYFFLLFRLL